MVLNTRVLNKDPKVIESTNKSALVIPCMTRNPVCLSAE